MKTSAQEECGVWLDTVELKGKAKQKRLVRPISKLLNPFVGGGGYNVGVALNFTQTKIEMPKTKQSSISTFFAPQRRDLNKTSTSEVPSIDPVQPSSSSTSSKCLLTAPTPVASGTKRRREIELESYNSEPGVDHEWKSKKQTEPDAAWQEQAVPSQTVFCDSEEEQFVEINSPQSKRRLIATSLMPDDSQPPPQAWSQDPLLNCSQYSEGDFYLTGQKNTTTKSFNDSEPSFFNSLQSEEAFGIRMDVEGRTSTQKSFKHIYSSFNMNDEKENNWSLFSESLTKRSPLSHIGPSNQKCTEPKTASPRKHVPVHLLKKSDKEESPDLQFKWAKPNSSPLKKVAPQLSRREVDEDSLATLFTQDSEGFRVIAHRGLQARSPLKDHSNMSTGAMRTSAFKCLAEEDEDDEMLFTQDSQGNLVIKH